MGDGRDSVDLADLFGLDGSRVRVGRSVGRAQQGVLYLRQNPYEAVKLFSPAYLFRSASQLRAKLTWMISHPPIDPGVSQRSLAWPRALIVDGAGVLAGYTLPEPPRTVALRQLTVAHDTPGRDGSRERRPAWASQFDDWRSRVEAAASLAALTAALHNAGYVIGDFSDSAVRITSRGQATLADCDGIQVNADGRMFLAAVGDPEFTPPELLAQRGRALTPAADDFALAVHCYGLLYGGHRPFSGLWRGGETAPTPLQLARWGLYATGGDPRLDPPADLTGAEVVPAKLRAMFELAFGPGAGIAQRRPTAADWHHALSALAADLVVCPRHPDHHYPSALAECPWCTAARKARAQVTLAGAAVTPAAPPSIGLPAAAPPGPPAAPAGTRTAAYEGAAAPSAPPPRRPVAGRSGAGRVGGGHRRRRAASQAWRWAGRLGAATLCLVGAALMVFTVISTVLPHGGSVIGAADDVDTSPSVRSLATALGAAGSSRGLQTRTPAAVAGGAPRPWLGRWYSAPTSLLPGFGLLLKDGGVAGDDQERISATEVSTSCPVRYEGMVPRSGGPGAGTSVEVTLDAYLPSGTDPAGCALLRNSRYYTDAGPGRTVTGAVRLRLAALTDASAQAWVMERPGDVVGLTLFKG